MGIEGNQPAISAYCETSKEEDEIIAEAIIRQKVGANPKTIKAHMEMTKARKERTDEHQGDILGIYRKARIACGATVRWKRSVSEGSDLVVTTPGEPPQHEQDSPSQGGLKYASRLLSCIRCGQPNETSWMQLRAKTGFRAIHCRV